jgi:cardiolipin synthase
MLALLCCAVERGVDVRVLLPSCGDSVIVDWACREPIGVLLEGGVGVWLCEGEFNHAKVMVVDDVLVAGSANFDYRSMRRNREVAALLRAPRCVDRVVAELSGMMDEAVHLCADEWRQRIWLDRVAERIVRPIAPFL